MHGSKEETLARSAETEAQQSTHKASTAEQVTHSIVRLPLHADWVSGCVFECAGHLAEGHARGLCPPLRLQVSPQHGPIIVEEVTGKRSLEEGKTNEYRV